MADACIICLEPLGAETRALACGHTFHAACIAEYHANDRPCDCPFRCDYGKGDPFSRAINELLDRLERSVHSNRRPDPGADVNLFTALIASPVAWRAAEQAEDRVHRNQPSLVDLVIPARWTTPAQIQRVAAMFGQPVAHDGSHPADTAGGLAATLERASDPARQVLYRLVFMHPAHAAPYVPPVPLARADGEEPPPRALLLKDKE